MRDQMKLERILEIAVPLGIALVLAIYLFRPKPKLVEITEISVS